MALILKADKLTINIPKVIETKNSIVLYGQCYNKHNFIPIPLKYFMINSTAPTLSTNKKMNPKAVAKQCEVWNEDTIITDMYEPDTVYNFMYNGSDKSIILKYKEFQNSIELVSASNFNLNYAKYLGQDKNYIYCAYRQFENISQIVYTDSSYSANRRSSCMQITKLDKQNLTSTVIGRCWYFYSFTDTSIANCIKILENESCIYYGGITNLIPNGSNFRLASTSLNIYKLSKANGSIEEVEINIPIGINRIFNFFDNKDVFEISDSSVCFYLMNLSDEYKPLKLVKLNINETLINNMVNVEDLTFVWNDEIKQSLSAFPEGVFYSYETFITKVNNKSYISIIMYQNADQYVTEQIVNQGIYTFEIIDFNNLKLTDYNRISNFVLKGYLLSKDRSFLIVSTASNTIFMKFDAEKGCFKITSTIEEVPLSIGLDLSERVWIMKADNEVDVYSMSNPTDFNMKFEKDYYDYVGTNIETFITVEAKNFLGEYININVELSIDGNAKFKDNSSSVIKITTPSDGELNIPVIITGSNQITVCPKILSEGESS